MRIGEIIGTVTLSRCHPSLTGGSYRLVAYERETRLCPPGLCREDDRSSFGGRLRSIAEDSSVVYGHLLLPKGLARNLPSVSESWEDFLSQGQDEVARFGRFLGTLRSNPRPELFYAHFLLPHSPWQYLPDGTRYSLRYPIPPWSDAEVWTTDGELLGVARWMPPGRPNVHVPAMLRALVSTPLRVREATNRFFAYGRAVESLRAQAVPEPHWYLAGIGVDPEHQRRGIGSALLAKGTDVADDAGLPCALLTNSGISRAYARARDTIRSQFSPEVAGERYRRRLGVLGRSR